MDIVTGIKEIIVQLQLFFIEIYKLSPLFAYCILVLVAGVAYGILFVCYKSAVSSKHIDITVHDECKKHHKKAKK